MLLHNSLNSFKSISLADLNGLNFDERQDSKFAFNENLLEELLPHLSDQYRILDISGKRCFRYQSLYLDTPEFLLYYDHHRGKMKRHKFRFRKYLDSGAVFFEIKTRNNKYRSHKLRIAVKDIRAGLTPQLKHIILEQTPIDPEELLPSLEVLLNRITFVHLDGSEKVTLDFNMQFKLNGEVKDMKGLAIAEVKQNRFNPESVFFKVQRQLKIYPSTVSKYCLGIACLNPNVKANRFKAGIRHFEKIIG